MKRFHVHVAVENLAESVTFYSDLFGMKPTVERTDYAKWMLEEPRVNFAISSRGHKPGVNHLGFQADNPAELAELGARAVRAAGAAVLKETEVECCYAKGNKYWVIDPQGLAWEHFQTLGEVPIFGEDTTMKRADGEACCIPLHSGKGSAAEESKGACCVPTASPDTAQPRKPGACC
ncbi:MAG: ArsI/CadI family heavy metal resistance metalloenzyme [Candidatus Binataceae bacterium]|jgi:catechol 2,3-dioxygenase-like lactoylglutathione lyase family enzyme